MAGHHWSLVCTLDTKLVNRPGFTLFRQDRDLKIQKRGGGVAAYVRDDIALYTTVIQEACDVTRNLEQMWLRIEEPGRKHFVIGIVYRPPVGSLKRFLEEMEKTLKAVFCNRRGEEHVVMGDFDIDFQHSEMIKCKNIKTLMNEFGLKHLATTFTRITKYSKSIIDLIFSNMQHVLEVGVRQVVISDHLPIFMVKKKQRNHFDYEIKEIRDMKRYNIQDLETIIRLDKRWEALWVESILVDDLWKIMHAILTESVDVLCPWAKKKCQIDKPTWVTKEVKRSIHEKNMLYRKAVSSKEEDDWENFRMVKKATSKLIVETKGKVMRDKLVENRNNPKRFWRQINRDILGNHRNNGIRVVKNENGKCLTGKEAAEYINIFYSEMGKDTENSPSSWDAASMNMERVDQEFEFKFIELLEIHQLVTAIDISKSSGVDGLNTMLLKECFKICEYELTYLFNCSINQKKFPCEWKRSIITPIPKTGDKLCPENWRPINNFCVPGKLLEKCVYRQIEEYMEKNCFICKNQHGFRKGKGTDTAVMELVRELMANINNEYTSSILFLDYSRAFNSVDHKILLKKLLMYGFSEYVVQWFIDYFKGRMQHTKFGTVLSPGVIIEHGVYQGSPLGPLLFIIYINDIVRINKNMFCNMYADDTVVVCRDKNCEYAEKQTGRIFDEIQQWCSMNKIKVNKRKTKHMIVGKNSRGMEAESIKDIVTVANFTYLGVNVDNRLNFEKFLNNTISRVNGRLITFARIRKLIDTKTSLLIYKQTILPILDYACVLVNSSTQRKIGKMQPLQNRAIRIILKKTGYICTEDMNKLHDTLYLYEKYMKLYCENKNTQL